MKVKVVIVRLKQDSITISESSKIKDDVSTAFEIKRTKVLVLAGCSYTDIEVVYE